MDEEKDDRKMTVVDKIKKAWDDDPVYVIFAASSVIFATSKLIESTAMARSRRISDRQNKYYFKQSRKSNPPQLYPPI